MSNCRGNVFFFSVFIFLISDLVVWSMFRYMGTTTSIYLFIRSWVNLSVPLVVLTIHPYMGMTEHKFILILIVFYNNFIVNILLFLVFVKLAYIRNINIMKRNHVCTNKDFNKDIRLYRGQRLCKLFIIDCLFNLFILC